MKTLLIAIAMTAVSAAAADAACIRWERLNGEMVCTLSTGQPISPIRPTGECVRWGWVGGAYVCIQSQ